jgi:hypothetical protein
LAVFVGLAVCGDGEGASLVSGELATALSLLDESAAVGELRACGSASSRPATCTAL